MTQRGVNDPAGDAVARANYRAEAAEAELSRVKGELEKLTTEADLLVRQMSGRKGRVVRESDVRALDDLLLAVAKSFRLIRKAANKEGE